MLVAKQSQLVQPVETAGSVPTNDNLRQRFFLIMLFKLFCTICFIGFINAAKQITVFQNNEVLSKIECLETDFSISNFDTLHNQTIVHVTVEEACNHKLPVQKLDNVTNVDLLHS